MRDPRQGIRNIFGTVVVAATVLAFGMPMLTLPAHAFSKRVERACKDDYKSLCPQYKVNSPHLRACMESKSSSISWGCIEALIDSGEVDKKRVSRR